MSRLSEDWKTVIVLPGTKKLRKEEYRGNTKIERVVCTEDMEEIGYFSFYGCTSLTSIELKPGLKRIGEYTFQGCTQLTHVSFVDGMEVIGVQCFQHCTALTSVELKTSLRSIGCEAFVGCTQLAASTVRFEDLPTSLRSIQVVTNAYQRLMEEIRSVGASELKNLIVSRPLTCPKTLMFDLSLSLDAMASKIVEIRKCEHKIVQSLHLVMLMLRRKLKWPRFGKVGIPILRYWFRGHRKFPLDTHALNASKSPGLSSSDSAQRMSEINWTCVLS